MIRKVKHTLRLTVLLLFICSMLGCTTTAHRFYSGLPLPGNEIALVYAVTGCDINDLRDKSEIGVKKFGGYNPLHMLEFIPGEYIVGVSYSWYSPGGTYGNYQISSSTTTGGRVQLNLNAQGGNIYVIYPEIYETKSTASNGKYSLEKTWRPILVNINDYSKEECAKYNGCWGCPGRLSCHDKDEIRKWATKYLQGERPVMIYHPPRVVEYRGERVVVDDNWW